MCYNRELGAVNIFVAPISLFAVGFAYYFSSRHFQLYLTHFHNSLNDGLLPWISIPTL